MESKVLLDMYRFLEAPGHRTMSGTVALVAQFLPLFFLSQVFEIIRNLAMGKWYNQLFVFSIIPCLTALNVLCVRNKVRSTYKHFLPWVT